MMVGDGILMIGDGLLMIGDGLLLCGDDVLGLIVRSGDGVARSSWTNRS